VLIPVALSKPHHSHHKSHHHQQQESTYSTSPAPSVSAHSFLGGGANIATSAAADPAGFAASAFNVAGNFATGVAQTVVGSTVHGAELAIDTAHAGAKGAVDAAKVGVEEAAVIGKNITQPIFPGTRWCGAGNKAKNDTEVGLFKDSDHCCM
jgi:Phospholipase A2